MEYAPLGGTGLEVSRIALGCGNFGGIGSAPEFFGQGETQEQAVELLDAARDLGITLLDTADAYGGGRSERWLGSWLARQPRAVRKGAVVTTKVFHSVAGDPTDRGLAPERIARQLRASLDRLRVEHVALYLIHEPDPDTPLSDTLVALDGLVRAGTVRAIGGSNLGAAELQRALAISEEQGLARFECVQNSYSLLDRSSADVLSICESGGNWNTDTGNGYSGGLQFAPGTWIAFGGARFALTAAQAARGEQITVAERVLAAQGWEAWPACSARLGLR